MSGPKRKSRSQLWSDIQRFHHTIYDAGEKVTAKGYGLPVKISEAFLAIEGEFGADVPSLRSIKWVGHTAFGGLIVQGFMEVSQIHLSTEDVPDDLEWVQTSMVRYAGVPFCPAPLVSERTIIRTFSDGVTRAAIKPDTIIRDEGKVTDLSRERLESIHGDLYNFSEVVTHISPREGMLGTWIARKPENGGPLSV